MRAAPSKTLGSASAMMLHPRAAPVILDQWRRTLLLLDTCMRGRQVSFISSFFSPVLEQRSATLQGSSSRVTSRGRTAEGKRANACISIVLLHFTLPLSFHLASKPPRIIVGGFIELYQL